MSPIASPSPEIPGEGAGYKWILEQFLTYPGTYEIPLRTMYTLNSAPSAQPQPRQSSRPDTPSLSSSGSSLDGSPKTPEFPFDNKQQLPQGGNTTDHFKQCLMEHISQLPSQPFTLPPVFITSFVRRCFTEDLCMVDFTQALTAMDYLKDLDNRRRRELTNVLLRLRLDKDILHDDNKYSGQNLRLAEWINSIREKDKKVESFFTQVYLGLRRWTLINEMRLEPFSKANCIAMLNTLYPPTTVAAPTRQLTPHILTSQRKAFFRYITGVEQNGKGILKNLENQGKKEGDVNGWTVIREIVDKYLRTANGLIEECAEITGPDFFTAEAESYRRSGRRMDSGVSFATGDRPMTSSSNQSHSTGSSFNKPLPAQPPEFNTRRSPPPPPKKRGTMLEKIAREFRNVRNRNDVKELSHHGARVNTDAGHAQTATETKEASKGFRGLRKMKSTSSIHSRDRSGSRNPISHSRSGSNEETLPYSDPDEQRRRMILEARKAKEMKAAGYGSDMMSRSGGMGRSLDMGAR